LLVSVVKGWHRLQHLLWMVLLRQVSPLHGHVVITFIRLIRREHQLHHRRSLVFLRLRLLHQLRTRRS
jgi:hypothetical protein